MGDGTSAGSGDAWTSCRLLRVGSSAPGRSFGHVLLISTGSRASREQSSRRQTLLGPYLLDITKRSPSG